MTGWMTLWTVLLVGSTLAFGGMLLVVGGGAIRELRQMLDELREDARESAEHPEILDEAT